MTEVVCDASVILKWFQITGEDDVGEARAVLAAHRAGRILALVLDLTLYEVGNVLIRALGRSAGDAATVLEALEEICAVLRPTAADRRLAVRLAHEQGLSFYDATYGAVAERRAATLVTSDRELLDARLGISPGALVARLGLTETI